MEKMTLATLMASTPCSKIHPKNVNQDDGIVDESTETVDITENITVTEVKEKMRDEDKRRSVVERGH